MQSKFAETAKHFGRLAAALLNANAKKATLYLSPKLTVKATLLHWGKTIEDRRHTRASIEFTVGVPNFEERLFIRKALKAGEPFPVKKAQLKFLPEPR
jgi:hypothetical protein